MSAVEKARVARKIDEKKQSRQKAKTGAEDIDAGPVSKAAAEAINSKGSGRSYRQREPVKPDAADRGRAGTKKDLDDVLGRLF